MKKRILIITFIMTSLLSMKAFSQSLSVNGNCFKADNYFDYGYGLTFYYSNGISCNLDYTISISFLHTDSQTEYGKLDFFQVPLLLGVRYYFVKSIISPYLSLEGGLSYFKNEQLNSKFINPWPNNSETETIVHSYDKFILGGGAAVGTYISLSTKIKLNLSGSAFIGKDRYADFLSYNAGIVYQL